MKCRLGFLLSVFLGSDVMLGYGFQDESGLHLDLSQIKSVEVGAFFTSFRSDLGFAMSRPLKQDYGLGGRLTFNLTSNVAVEAETAYIPESGVPKLTTLFGPKVGIRRRNLGLFGKARPGFVSIESQWGPGCLDDIRIVCPRYTEWRQYFTLDLGGVIEIYNFGIYRSDRLLFRLDIGDMFTRFGDIDVKRPRHNLQLSIGAGYRF
jgi:hypothetical protein